MVASFFIYTLTMKSTNEKIKELTAQMIGKKTWNVRETIGIKLELGNKIEKDRGEFHLWISTAHWWLQQGEGKNFKDIIHSESNIENIAEKITILDNKLFLGAEYHEETNGIFLDFSDNLFLRIAPYSGKKRNILQIFSARQIISIHSDGTCSVTPTDG